MKRNARLGGVAGTGDNGGVTPLRPVHLTLEDAMRLAVLAHLELFSQGWAVGERGELVPPPDVREVNRQDGEALMRLDDAIERQFLERSAAHRRREASRHPVSAPPEGNAS